MGVKSCEGRMAPMAGLGSHTYNILHSTHLFRQAQKGKPREETSRPPKEILLGSGCLHEQLDRRRYHKQQHRLWFSGGFQKFDISLPQIWAEETILTQIIQSLQADLCNPGQVLRHWRQIFSQVRSPQ